MKCIAYFVFVVQLVAFASDLEDRSFLQNLKPKEIESYSTYESNFLIVQSASAFELSTTQLKNEVERFLQKAIVPISSHFRKEQFEIATPQSLKLPPSITSGDQLEAIQKCNQSHCLMKLHIESEKSLMEKSKNKTETYYQLILQRVNDYLQKKFLKGYEERLNNQDYFKTMLGLLTFLKKDYSNSYEFLNKHFWSNTKTPHSPQDSFLRMEVVEFKRKQLQPILRISEVFLFKEKEEFLFFELHIYTNHYFDASARMFEIKKSAKPNQSILAITDIMDIDTLKISGLVRMLYTTPMREAIQEYQEKELKELIENKDAKK